MRFIGRRKELALFSKELGSGRAASILLYGRRRVGKTTLFRTVLNEASGIRILYTCLPAELAEKCKKSISRDSQRAWISTSFLQ